MDSRPSVDDCFDRLRREGWRLDEKARSDRWQVCGTQDGITIQAEGLTREAAWQRAWEQAPRRDQRWRPVVPPPLWATLLFYGAVTVLLFGLPTLLGFVYTLLFDFD